MAEQEETPPQEPAANALLQSTASHTSVTSNQMLNAKLMRRKVQQDMELLSNRIERLRAEERKAKSKVVETKLRGQEIMSLQKRNEQHAASRMLARRLDEERRERDCQAQQLRKAVQATYCT
jgi:hypothetical protein